MLRLLCLLCAFFATHATAAEPCREKSLIHFFAGSQEVPSQLIGAGDPCDHFGGNLAYSPAHQRYVYVNFNIPGRIDLDAVDAAYELAPASGDLHDSFARVELAVVDKGWIKRTYDDDREAILNLGGDTLFVSEVVVEEGRFTGLLREFYSGH